jgi:putative ABC transport system permease protein
LFEILRLRLRSLFTGSRMDGELDEEVRFHIEAEAEELVARGLSESEARRAAEQRFGHVTNIRDECRDARAVRLWDDLFQDCRYSARSLLGTPLLSAVAVLTLALGIGANTAVFSVVYSVILRPLPYPDPERLVWITQYFPRFDSRLVPGSDFLAWQGHAQSFEAMGRTT